MLNFNAGAIFLLFDSFGRVPICSKHWYWGPWNSLEGQSVQGYKGVYEDVPPLECQCAFVVYDCLIWLGLLCHRKGKFCLGSVYEEQAYHNIQLKKLNMKIANLFHWTLTVTVFSTLSLTSHVSIIV